MHLSAVDIIGFKSFANRTKLTFEPGIIAIVGPNGCGKTNIVDSIRWVLGEQSAKSLRGKRMEDVIFHGTDNRKGLGMVEVSLIVDNVDKALPIDYSEVTITRRMFRSGESQYFINKNLCRLRDIDNLFMDTGVGTNAYSVLEQGKMDLILSSKPEDRRFVFEEAAGITKYKERKREALHKLEITESNLVRLNDIIKEVGRQIGSMERKAAKARRYKRIQEELKGLEVKMLSAKMHKLQQEKDEYNSRKEDTAREAARMQNLIKEKEEEIATLRKSIQQLNQDIITFHEAKLAAETRLVTSRQQRQYKEERIGELQKRNSDIELEITRIKQELDNWQRQLQETERELVSAAEMRQQHKDTMKGKQREINQCSEQVARLAAGIESKREELFQLTARGSQQKNELVRVDMEFKDLVLKERRETVELNQKRREAGKLAREIEETEVIVRSQQRSLYSLRHIIKDREEKMLLLKDEAAALQGRVQEQQQQFSEKRSRFEIYSNQKRSLEGYTAGVRMVLEEKGRFPGVLGTVSELIRVPVEYGTAINALLGERAQWLVCDSLANARQAAELLHQHSVTQTTFVILELLEDVLPVSRENFSFGECLPALDIVDTENNCQKLIDFLFGRVIISPNIAEAEKLSRLQALTVVTPDGRVVDSQGIIKAGKGIEGLINLIDRETTIESLKGEMALISEDVMSLTQKKKMIEDKLKQEEGQIEGARNNLYREEISLAVQENDLLKYRSSYKQLLESIETIEIELKELSSRKESAARQQQDYANSLAENDRMTGLLNFDHKNVNEELARAEQELDQREREFTELKISLISAEEKENHLVFKQQQLQQQISGCETSRDKIQAEYEHNGTAIKLLIEETQNLAETVEVLTVAGQEQENKLVAIRQQSSQQEEELRRKEDYMRQEREARDKIGSQLNERQLKLAELQLKIDDITKKLWDNYHVSLEGLAELVIESNVLEALEQETLTLRDRLESMGEVSLVAIEEYEELQERFQFMTTQKEDLVNSKDSLLKAIAQVNKTTKQIFWDTFQAIRSNFHEVFTRLFGGGKADLILLDESDILESGIEIIARPPGKRLQNVSLLSGGEKALTAISLLFAMFKVKPSPFCILDEIDAPLDDSNIDRFVGLLRDFSQLTQFMVVTHNKRTIGAASVLYGVTMEERGVSRVVSIKFSRKEKIPQPVNA